MKRIIIFGAGGSGMRYSNDILQRGEDKIVCFLDNSRAKQGTQINGIDVFAPEKILELGYDSVAIAVALGFEDDIVSQLKELGINENKIEIPALCGGGGEIYWSPQNLACRLCQNNLCSQHNWECSRSRSI